MAKLNKILESNIFICAIMSVVGLSMCMNGKNTELLGRFMGGLGVLLIVEAWALFVLKEIKDFIKKEINPDKTP